MRAQNEYVGSGKKMSQFNREIPLGFTNVKMVVTAISSSTGSETVALKLINHQIFGAFSAE